MSSTWTFEHVVTLDGVLSPGTIEVDADRIVAVRPAADSEEPRVGWLVPGFVDLHCHGGGGVSFTDADPMPAILAHRRRGTTTQYASTVTAPLATVLEQVERLRPYVESGDLSGVHLEGPWLAPSMGGAHDVDLLRDPTTEDVAPLLATGLISMITFAPERCGALDAIRQTVAAGTVAAFGHSAADAETTQAAVQAGCTVATHLYNAMPPMHHRTPGPVPVLLADDRVIVELILDGHHVSPQMATLAVRAAKDPNRVALVTDAMAATGVCDGRYLLGELEIDVVDGVARRADDPGALAGSTLTMADAFAFAVQRLGLGIDVVARMAATTPARGMGRTDVGALAAGRRADACVVDDQGRLRAVARRGEWLSDAADAE